MHKPDGMQHGRDTELGVPSMPGHMPDKGIPHKHWRNILRLHRREMLLSGHIHYIYDYYYYDFDYFHDYIDYY